MSKSRQKLSGYVTQVLLLPCGSFQHFVITIIQFVSFTLLFNASAKSSSWNFTGPTPTQTLGMRLSYNFVNVYTIAYRVHYARIPNGHPREDRREENRACRTSRRTSRQGSSCMSACDKRAALPQLTASCGRLNGRHVDILATIFAKMSVSVSVSVPWNFSLSRYYELF